MWKIISILLLPVTLTGCMTQEGAFASARQPVLLTEPASAAIAGDMAGRLADQMEAPDTVTLLVDDGSADHATAIETALRGYGFAVVADVSGPKDPAPLVVSYALERSDDLVLARLSTPSLTLARAYSTNATGAKPESPLSIMKLN